MNPLLDRINTAIRPRGHVFHGWYIVLASCGIQWLPGVLLMHSFGAYAVLIEEEFGWSKALVAGGFALTRVESGLLGPLQGWLTDRFGPRIILAIGLALFGAGFIAFGMVDTILTYYLAFALIALGSSLGGFHTVMVAIVNWFDRYRSRAVAISQMGFALGGLSVPLVVFSLEALGWRTTAILSGIAVIVLGVPLTQVIRHRPQGDEMPDGAYIPKEQQAEGHPVDARRDFTAREALRTRAFWFISLGHSLALLTVSAVMVHLVPHLTEGMSFELTTAGFIVAMLMAFQMVGQLVGGYLGDHFNKRLVCVACMLAHASGFLLLAYSTNLAMVVGFALLHGLGWGVRGPLMVAFRADYFGATSFGTIMGFSSLIVMIGMSVGPILAGYMADVTGDYQAGFALIALGSLLGAVFFWGARRPERPTRAAVAHT